MQVLALDIGLKRVGVAKGDTNSCISLPIKVLPANDVINNSPSWKRLIEDYEPEMLIFGLPKSLDGNSGKQAQNIQMLASQIAKNASLPYEFIDERLSSSEAKCIMHKAGMTERDMRGKLDMIAASLFLQTWLDMNQSKE